jgi:hypothetical protein
VQSYTIVVRGGNLPPTITSTPVVIAAMSHLNTYAVVANDPDGDPLSYAVSTNPSTSVAGPLHRLQRSSEFFDLTRSSSHR